MDADKLRTLQIPSQAKRRSTRPWWIIVAVILLLLAVGGYIAFLRPEAAQRVIEPSPAPPAQSPTAPASAPMARIAPVDAILTVSGYIVNRERIEISPRFMGVVTWVGVQKGDTVTNSQVVVRLDATEHRARLHEAEGRLAQARVAVTKADLDYHRVQQLIRDRIETRQNEDDLRLRLESAQASVQEVEGHLALMKIYLDWTEIRSPIHGVVLEKLVDPGELVTPQSFGGSHGPKTAVLAIADPNDLQVEIDLNEADVAKVFLGQHCRIIPEAWPDKSYRGSVAEISPEADRQKGTLQIKVQIQQPDRFLTPELTAKVDFLQSPRVPSPEAREHALGP